MKLRRSIALSVAARAAILMAVPSAASADANAYLNPLALNLNKGNKQIAHGITAVLRPLDLP